MSQSIEKPLSSHIESYLMPIRKQLPILMGVAVAIFFLFLDLTSEIKNQNLISKLLANQLSVFVETNDSTEIKRLISNSKKSIKRDIEIFNDNTLLASTVRPFKEGLSQKKLILKNYLPAISFRSKIERVNGPKMNAYVVIFLPVVTPLIISLFIGLLIYFCIYHLVQSRFNQVSSEIKKLVAPISKIPDMISKIDLKKQELDFKKTKIFEVNAVAITVKKTSKELKKASFVESRLEVQKVMNSGYESILHDLTTPALAVDLLLSGISKDSLKGLEKEDLIQARTSSRGIVSQLEQIKEQISYGKLTYTKTENILPVVAESKEELEAIYKTQEKQIEIVDQVNLIETPFNKLLAKRTFSNIIKNALEAANSKVVIKTKQKNGKSIIEFHDDGRGMSEASFLDHINGRGLSSKREGVGLGLMGVKVISNLHGWKLFLRKSEVLGGCCFAIQI